MKSFSSPASSPTQKTVAIISSCHGYFPAGRVSVRLSAVGVMGVSVGTAAWIIVTTGVTIVTLIGTLVAITVNVGVVVSPTAAQAININAKIESTIAFLVMSLPFLSVSILANTN